MSIDESTKGIEDMRDTGKISPRVARDAINHPVSAEALVRMERIEEGQLEMRRSMDDMNRALFGDEIQQIKGLVHDVLFLKINYWRGVWTIAGGIAVGGFFVGTAITFLGLYIACTKH